MSEKQLAVVEIERLERIVAGDAAAPAFPALAEAHRRTGDPKRAEEVARAGLAGRSDHVAGVVALGLALIDQGRTEEELDAAFEMARPEAEAMVDANDLAREALRRTDATPEEATELVTAQGSPFATRTVADLLEQQGDPGNADVVRRSLGEKAQHPDDERRRRVVATLEGWLVKLRGGASR